MAPHKCFLCLIISLLTNNVQLHQLYLPRGGFDDLELESSDFYHLVQLWKTLIFMQYQSAQGHVVIALRQLQVEHLVHLVYLQSGRQQVVTLVGLLSHIL